ncbi:hypothetical protein OK349_16840 [Sphingomonas sp. BT-65]|uniref:DUF4139 domain-containing protein n=1 Tax=Sphingomonas sp. BT-65 TaxID=2989821 RepID=UPI0022360077|nr:hypothetical protein [Sphingomonas sp. BT-65]MCW4463376.1 hypothetical protein [Sphingomonas sp. BT-65]
MRRLRISLLTLAMLAGAGGAQAQSVQTSAAPDSVAVTVYRAPNRDADTKINLGWLGGYALITETRTITIPAGRAVIRFEGVASGILPESAIVTGLPAGVREKNLDGELLSAASLYSRGYARPVTLRRTRDGKTVEERAVIRSGPEGSAIVETARGFEVLNCGPTEDAIAYDGVPAGLSAKPTLSVETESPQGGTATVTLSYLAWGFDWQANYVATLHPGAAAADLFAWVTLASTDMTSFADAQTMVVAGKVNRTTGRTSNPYEAADTFEFRCYLKEPVSVQGIVDFAPPPPPPPPAPMAMRAEAIVVTGSRMRKVVQEDLGDLKAYRVPEPTTVAAKSQKQVALLAKDAVPVRIVYVADFYPDQATTPRIELRAVNKADKGLGLPLPAGPVALFERHGKRELLIGESATDDKAVGEDVEIKFQEASNVTLELRNVKNEPKGRQFEAVVRNANPFAIRFEGDFEIGDDRVRKASARLGKKDGRSLWAVTVPANGSATLRYTLSAPR